MNKRRCNQLSTFTGLERQLSLNYFPNKIAIIVYLNKSITLHWRGFILMSTFLSKLLIFGSMRPLQLPTITTFEQDLFDWSADCLSLKKWNYLKQCPWPCFTISLIAALCRSILNLLTRLSRWSRWQFPSRRHPSTQLLLSSWFKKKKKPHGSLTWPVF